MYLSVCLHACLCECMLACVVYMSLCMSYPDGPLLVRNGQWPSWASIDALQVCREVIDTHQWLQVLQNSRGMREQDKKVTLHTKHHPENTQNTMYSHHSSYPSKRCKNIYKNYTYSCSIHLLCTGMINWTCVAINLLELPFLIWFSYFTSLPECRMMVI